jgi:hypothetical protein
MHEREITQTLTLTHPSETPDPCLLELLVHLKVTRTLCRKIQRGPCAQCCH